MLCIPVLSNAAVRLRYYCKNSISTSRPITGGIYSDPLVMSGVGEKLALDPSVHVASLFLVQVSSMGT